MPASQEQKVDFLLKKIGYSASKTGIAEDESTISSSSNTAKAPFEEGIASPLVIPQSSILADSGYIPTTPPGSDTAYVKGYRTATALRMTRDSTVGTNTRSYIAYTTYNDTSSARLTNWIDTQFGASYIIKVFKGDPNSGGVELQQAGANAGTDGWFFDYSSGILNFNGVNLPSGISATNIYIVGYRYIGAIGIRPPAGIGTFEHLHVAGVSTFMGSIDANSNLDVVGISTFNNTVKIADTIEHLGDTNTKISFPDAGDQIVFEAGGHERLRITHNYVFGQDATGRAANYNNTSVVPKIQLENNTEASLSVARFSNNTDSSRIFLQKARGSVGSAAVVQDNDTLGMIVFNGYNGSGFRNAAQILAEVDGEPTTSGDNTDMPGALIFKTSEDGTNVPAERLRITSDGKVGINSSSPQTTLEVVGVGVSVFNQAKNAAVNISGAGKIELIRSDSVAYIDFKSSYGEDFDCRIQQYNNGLRFYTGGHGSTDERLHILSDGNVGIGTSIPAAKLNVVGNTKLQGNLNVTGLSTFTGTIDANGLIEATAGENKIPSLYANYSNLPNASSYHGLFAHVHQHARGYFAHGGNWMELVNKEVSGIVGTGTETYNVGFLDATNLDVTGITTLGSIGISTGRITGPAITYIDPATVGDDTGTLVVKGNLQVEGTQTVVNSSIMTVTDVNIELAKGAANDAAADTGGITVKGGTDKTWQWLDATDSWTSSEHIRIPDGKVFGFTPDTNTYIGRPAADTIAFTHGGSEKVRITSTGSVGIGTTNPASNSILHLYGGDDSDCILILEADRDNSGGENHNPYIVFQQDGGIGHSVIGVNPHNSSSQEDALVLSNSANTNGGIIFRTDSSNGWANADERLRITSAGNVGINSTAPTALLDVIGDTKLQGDLNVTGVSTFVGNAQFNNNVGIGTTNPATDLHIHSGTPRITMSDSGTGVHHKINADSSVGNFNFDIDYDSVTSTPAFIVNIKGGEKLRIESDGKVGINSTVPTALLNVKGTAKIGDYEQLEVVTGGQVQVKYQNSSRLSTNGTGATFQGNLDFLGNTNYKARFGASKDLEIFHGYDGTFDDISLVRDIRAGIGTLAIEADNVFLRNKGGSQNYFEGTDDAGVKLNFAGAQRLETTDTGVGISSNLTVSGISTFTGAIDANGDLDVDGHTELDNLKVVGVATFTGGGAKFENGIDTFDVRYITNTNTKITFGTGIISLHGNVGINSTSPKQKLDVIGNINVSGITTTTQLEVGTLGQSLVGITTILDEDNMASDSATALATQQSIKAYVDGGASPSSSLAVSADSGSNESINLVTEVLDIEGTTNEIETATGTNKVVIGLPNNVTIGNNLTVTALTDTDTLTTGNATFTGTVSAGSTTGIDGYYLKSTGIGVTWAVFPSSRTTSTQTATAGQTSFNFNYNVGFVDVFLNGVKLPSSEFTANNGSTIVLDDAAFANDTLEFISLNTIPVTSGGGASNLDGLSDVNITSPVYGQTLRYNGVKFVNDFHPHSTTTSTSQVSITNLPIASYRSAEYLIQVTEGTKYHVTKIIAIHDGTNVTFNEYGTITTSTPLATFLVDINSGIMRLLATPASTNSTSFKVKFDAIAV